MRNLVQYPLTEREIIACLQRLEGEARGERLLGDMRPLILATVAEIVKSVGEINRSAGDSRDTRVHHDGWPAGELARAIVWDETTD